MQIVSARNVHTALVDGLKLLRDEGFERDSRNGPVVMVDGPVTSHYWQPTQRVLFHPLRDANPFFHFYEMLWMIGGRQDVKSVAHFAGNMKNYSDDGKTFHGAYGYRWRNHFGFDQLYAIVQQLKKNRDDRRCVLQMWNANFDLGRDGKDFPCNTQVYFSINRDGVLDMTVCNRSNDVIWGCYGANAVHFSALQEFMAAWIGVPVGMYWQMSNNYHAYKDVYEKNLPLVAQTFEDPYVTGEVEPYQMVNTPVEIWQQDLVMFLGGDDVTSYQDPFFRKVAKPIVNAFNAFKNLEYGDDRFEMGIAIMENCAASDWRKACSEYILRREKKWRTAQDDGPIAA